jgi:hypothetical protein
MRFACWISKATDPHSEYVIHIAFRRQQWLWERASMLCYTYIPCLVCNRKAASVLWVIDVSYKTKTNATFETPRKIFSTDDVINENNQKYSLAKWIQTLHLRPGGRYGKPWHNKQMSWQHCRCNAGAVCRCLHTLHCQDSQLVFIKVAIKLLLVTRAQIQLWTAVA